MLSQFYRDITDKKEPLAVGAIAGMILVMIATSRIAPALFGVPIEPPLMVNHFFGLPESSLIGWIAHLLVGLVIFPLGYMLIGYRHFPGPALVKGILYALLIGTVAGVSAPLTGNEMFMGSQRGAMDLYLLHGAYCCLIALIVGNPMAAEQSEQGQLAGS